MPHSDTAFPEAQTVTPSAARLAAESAFSSVTTTAPATDGGPVVIVRRKKLAVADEHDDGSHGDDLDEAARPSKVYRVDSGPNDEPHESAAARGVDKASEGGELLRKDGGVFVSRRRRHSKHGGVTIVRPAPPTASELAERTRIAKVQYERLRAEILKLDRQIEAAREVEVGKAVRWIRMAMAEYGLEAKDLGLS
jgi:hypothetical protein